MPVQQKPFLHIFIFTPTHQKMHASSIIAGWVFICAHVHATDPGGGADGNAGELSEYQRGFNAGVKAGECDNLCNYILV